MEDVRLLLLTEQDFGGLHLHVELIYGKMFFLQLNNFTNSYV